MPIKESSLASGATLYTGQGIRRMFAIATGAVKPMLAFGQPTPTARATQPIGGEGVVPCGLTFVTLPLITIFAHRRDGTATDWTPQTPPMYPVKIQADFFKFAAGAALAKFFF